jgi:SAM-dependent methyltransferase
MSELPQTWHYGLIARWWAEFNQPDPEELALYQGVIEQNGQPALDLACGTGRLLLPLLRVALDVDGCDVSADMLALCRGKAEREGLMPRLYRQAMHTLSLPRIYRTIFICDSFGIGGTREQDLETLRRCYRHLAPGGTLVFSHYPPHDNADEWTYWLPRRRHELPAPWPESALRKRAADGDEIALSSRLVDLDPLQQRQTRQIRAQLWRGDECIQEEVGFLLENLYFVPELRLMLAATGFSDVDVREGYTDQPATPDTTALVFIARKELTRLPLPPG